MSPEVAGTTTLVPGSGYTGLRRPHDKGVFGITESLFDLDALGITNNTQVLIGATIGSHRVSDGFWPVRFDENFAAPSQVLPGFGGLGMWAFLPEDVPSPPGPTQRVGFILDGLGNLKKDLLIEQTGVTDFFASAIQIGNRVLMRWDRYLITWDFQTGDLLSQVDISGETHWGDDNPFLRYFGGKVHWLEYTNYASDGVTDIGDTLDRKQLTIRVHEVWHSNADRSAQARLSDLRSAMPAHWRGRPLRWHGFDYAAQADDGSIYGIVEEHYGESPLLGSISSLHDYAVVRTTLRRILPDGSLALNETLGMAPEDSSQIGTATWDNFLRGDGALGVLPWRFGSWFSTMANAASISSHVVVGPTPGNQSLDLAPAVGGDGSGWFTLTPEAFPVALTPPNPTYGTDVSYIAAASADGSTGLVFAVTNSGISSVPFTFSLYYRSGGVNTFIGHIVNTVGPGWGFEITGTSVRIYSANTAGSFGGTQQTFTLSSAQKASLGSYVGIGFGLINGGDGGSSVAAFGWSPKYPSTLVSDRTYPTGGTYMQGLMCPGDGGNDALLLIKNGKDPVNLSVNRYDIRRFRPDGSISTAIETFGGDVLSPTRNSYAGPICLTTFVGALSTRGGETEAVYRRVRGDEMAVRAAQ